MKQGLDLKKIFLFENNIFPSVNTGPITITLFDNTGEKFTHPELEVFNKEGKKMSTSFNYGHNTFYKTDEDKYVDKIIEKIKPSDVTGSFANQVSAQRSLGIEGKHFKNSAAKFTSNAFSKFTTKVLVNEKLLDDVDKREFYFIDNSDPYWSIRKTQVAKWKVAFPATGSNQRASNYVLAPGELATDKYLIVTFNNRSEAENYQKYLKTKFYIFLMSPLLVDQNALRKTHRNVPIQDFSNKSDIDWTKSIAEIDKQLYKKYKLDKEEIDFIETHVKPMI